MVRGELIDENATSGCLTLVSGVNVRALPIGPSEAFVLSRVDGLSPQEDLAVATGISLEELAAITKRLLELGAVRWVSNPSPSQPSPARSGAHAIAVPSSRTPDAECVELSDEQQRQLLDWDQRCTSLDHYQLLGVEATAESKAIRAAYYELVHQYHPDRFFGRQLGRFEAPLLRVFGKFTEAYETLRRQETRAEYDRYLAARQRTLAFERDFYDPSRRSAEVASAMQRIQHAVDGADASTSSLPSGALRRASASLVVDPEARRRALARKLGHSSTPPGRPSSGNMPAASIPPSSAAAEELRRRFEQRLQRARDEQRDHYVALSREAAARNDLSAAANALRVACSLDPNKLELESELADLEQRAAAGLAEAYTERAKYAALEGRIAEAAECYERAAQGQPSAALCERAAHFTLEAGGDLRKASQLAKLAVSLAPNNAKCHFTLAQVYAAAKLRESALAELERARALDPDQPLIKEWIARVKRGDV